MSEKLTLQHFKDEVAKDMKFKSYAQVFNADNKHGIEMIIDEAAERYARYVANKAWTEGHIKGYDFATQPKKNRHLFGIETNPYKQKGGKQ